EGEVPSRMTANGVSLAYAMGFVNALMALLFSFGVNITDDQRSAIVGLVNAGLVLVAHVAYSHAKTTKPVIPAPPIDESSNPTEH
ncbi:MAG TPA: hypothetical protein VKA83_25465, partial [Methylomirabilota bacterium]|nr:hypothetical protein [Methylomirabilota bacterium]